MSLRDNLLALRNLLTEEEHFAQRTYARDSQGKAIDLDNPLACKFCIYGGLALVMGTKIDPACDSDAGHLIRTVAYNLYRDSPVAVNDRQGHAAVLRVIDAAIEMAQP
jgi:hypothetical protein